MKKSSLSHPLEVTGSTRLPLGMPPSRFLREYWQKRPLLIRRAFPPPVAPLSPNDLAGLACEETALARIIQYDSRQDHWQLREGPFDTATFAALPEENWTLLVQDVDKWDTDVADLLEPFRFLPSWRLDDVMVSYATAGAGVGPHIDQYDVFLLQGMGRRHWSINTHHKVPTELRDNVELPLLKQFSPTHSWTLEPGDMLYLPPGMPHDGVAENECLTFSIGMRAPAVAELLVDLAEYRAESFGEELRYADPDLQPARAIGLIDNKALERLRTTLGSMAGDLNPGELGNWFGGMITRYRCTAPAAPPARCPSLEQIVTALAHGRPIVRHPFTRFAWIRHSTGIVKLFASGHAVLCTESLAEALCTYSSLPADHPALSGKAACLCLHELMDIGALTLGRKPRQSR